MRARYFYYHSKYKIEEAYEQVGAPAMRFAARIKVPVIPVEAETDLPDAQTVYARLEAAEQGLNKEGQIGSIGAPGGWFRGTMTMKQTFLGREPSGDPDVVFFIGNFADITVALGGSAWNAPRSGYNEEQRSYSNSGEHTLMIALHAESLRIRATDAPGRTSAARLSEAWAAEATELMDKLPGPGNNVEFVARFLRQGTAHWEHEIRDYGDDAPPHPVLLGTPLYVASAVGIARPEPPKPKPRLHARLRTRFNRSH